MLILSTCGLRVLLVYQIRTRLFPWARSVKIFQQFSESIDTVYWYRANTLLLTLCHVNKCGKSDNNMRISAHDLQLTRNCCYKSYLVYQTRTCLFPWAHSKKFWFNNFLSLLIPIDTEQTHCCQRYVMWINVANQITICGFLLMTYSWLVIAIRFMIQGQEKDFSQPWTWYKLS